jgi:PAS domain S-box-containing protein
MRAIRHEKELLQQKVNEAVSEVEKQKQSMEEKNLQLMETQEEIKRNNWIANNLAAFGDLLRQEKSDLAEFSYDIIRNLIRRVDAHVGAIYLLNQEESGEPEIEMIACYAYDQKKQINKKIYIGEGMVGRSIKTREIIHQQPLPENYITIKSGLGETNPDSLLIVPLVTGEEVYGAIEIARLGDFRDIHRSFLENVAEDIAITFRTTLINLKTNRLLEQSREQYNELSSQKEEMHQNMEELKATQEESERRKAEMESLIEALKTSNFFIKYDSKGYILDINQPYLDLVGKHSEELIGKNHLELEKLMLKSESNTQQLWEALLNGETRKDTVQFKNQEKLHTLACVYTPIVDQKGNTENILQIGLDVTDHSN